MKWKFDYDPDGEWEEMEVYADDCGEIYIFTKEDDTSSVWLKYRGVFEIRLPLVVFEPNGFHRIARESLEKILIEEGKATEYEGKVYWTY